MKSFANRQKPVWRNANPVPQSGHTFIDQRPESRAQRQMIETIRQSPVATPGIVPQQQPVMPQVVVQQKSSAPLQMIKENDFIGNPEEFMAENVILFNYSDGFRQRYPETCTTVADKIDKKNFESAIKAVMVANKSGLKFSLRLQEVASLDNKPIYFLAPELSALPDQSLNALFANGGVQLDNAAELIKMMKDEKDASIESLIDAQYVPYFNGTPQKHKAANANLEQAVQDEANGPWGDVGSSLIDPDVTRFVFTDAMNGCAYAITGVENSKTQFVAWHFQSETDNWKAASTFRAVKEIRDWYGVNDYYPGPVQGNLAATNIIWQDEDDGWKMLSQRNIVPLDQHGSTTFDSFAVKDLNVKDKISQENLELLHDTLKAKAVALVSNQRVANINQRIQNLQIEDELMTQSLQRVNVENGSLSAAATGEFGKIEDGFKRIKGNKDSKPEIFQGMGDASASYKKIPLEKNLIGMASHPKNHVIACKKLFKIQSENLKKVTLAFLNNRQANPVTTSLEADDKSYLECIRQVRDYYDLYGLYNNTYNATTSLVTDLEALCTAKRNAVEKKTTLELEMNKIYPPQQVQPPQQQQQQQPEQQVQLIEEEQS